MSGDGFTAVATIVSIEFGGGVDSAGTCGSAIIEMIGTVSQCPDLNFPPNRKSTSVFKCVLMFGEPLQSGHKGTAAACIGDLTLTAQAVPHPGAKEVDLLASVRATLDWPQFSWLLALREHQFKVAPVFYRSVNGKTKRSAYLDGTISYIQCLYFAPYING